MIFDVHKLLSHFLGPKTKSPLTIKAYSKDLEYFRNVIKASTVEEAVKHLLAGGHCEGQELIAQYILRMSGPCGLGPATINRRLSTLRSLGKESRILGMVPWVLTAKNVRHEAVRDNSGLSEANAIKLLAYMEELPRTKAVLRDRAFIRLIMDHAMSRGAVRMLDMADFNAHTSELMVLKRGRRQKQIRQLSDRSRTSLSEWVVVRGLHPGAIFINFDTLHSKATGKRLSGSGIYAILKSRANAAGIYSQIRPNGLRHSSIFLGAYEAAKRGYGLDKIIEHSGHKNVRTLKNLLTRTKSISLELSEAVSQRLG